MGEAIIWYEYTMNREYFDCRGGSAVILFYDAKHMNYILKEKNTIVLMLFLELNNNMVAIHNEQETFRVTCIAKTRSFKAPWHQSAMLDIQYLEKY